MLDNKIKLTPENLQRYGQIVLVREWTSLQGTNVAEKYIIWDTDRMNGLPEEKCHPNKKKMYLLTMVNGEQVTMKAV